MFASALNAAIALIEGRTDYARSILQDPRVDMEGQSFGQLECRLAQAVDTAAKREVVQTLKCILLDSLRLTAPEGKDPAAYLEGMQDLVDLMERKVEQLEKEVGSVPFTRRI
jgi:hypothetical protein